MWLSGRRADKQEAETQLLKTVPMTEKVLHSGRIFCKIIERQRAKSARSALSEKTAADCRVRRRTEQTDTNAPNYSNNYNNNYNYIYNCNEGDVEAFCSICCRTKKTDPNYFCVKLRPRRPLRQQYRKKTEGKMLKINQMTVTDGTGAALVSDSVKEYIVEVNYSYQDKPYRVSIYKGELLESYDELQYSMRSRFAEIFRKTKGRFYCLDKRARHMEGSVGQIRKQSKESVKSVPAKMCRKSVDGIASDGIRRF